MADRPDKLPEWAASGAIVEPSSGIKAVGWVGGEEPPAEYFNWWQNLAYQWALLQSYVYEGRRVWRCEPWHIVTADLTPAPNFGFWTATGGFASTIENPDATQTRRYLKLAGGTGIDLAAVGSEQFHYFNTDSDVDLEFTIEVDSYGTSTDYLIEAGLVFSTTDFIVFEKDEASANWYYRCQAAASATTRGDTGVVATAGQVYRMRIRYSGHATTPTARFYIDDVLVATVTDNDVPRAMNLITRFKNEGLSGAQTIGHVFIGPVTLSYR
jgi:hypothetical protein